MYSIGRAGHHAGLWWIAGNTPGPVVYVNACLRDPLCSRGDGTTSWRISEQGEKTLLVSAELNSGDYYIPFEKTVDIMENPDRYIDDPLFQDNTWSRAYTRRRWLQGETEKVVNMVFLRDPFNHAASFIRSRGILPPRSQYLGLCKEALGETSLLGGPIVMLYNEWFLDQQYRIQLGERLGLGPEYKDPLMAMTQTGGGSSFDAGSRRCQVDATSMKVIDRWKFMREHELMRTLAEDEEVVDYAQRLFGHLHPLDKWVREILGK